MKTFISHLTIILALQVFAQTTFAQSVFEDRRRQNRTMNEVAAQQRLQNDIENENKSLLAVISKYEAKKGTRVDRSSIQCTRVRPSNGILSCRFNTVRGIACEITRAGSGLGVEEVLNPNGTCYQRIYQLSYLVDCYDSAARNFRTYFPRKGVSHSACD